jgi:hypothetical protein
MNADWDLFVDWCLASDVDAVPAGRSLVEAFLNDAPAAASTQLRRVQSIRRALEDAGYVLDIPVVATASTVRTGEGWGDLGRSLAQLPKFRTPIGLRGRRDGWLLVLIVGLGMSRRQSLAVEETDVELFPALTVCGKTIERAQVAEECAACAVTRWLRVIGPASQGWRSDVNEILNARDVDIDLHDCATGLDGMWRRATVLTPAIDRHGWVSTAAPLSKVAVSSIMAARQRLAGMPERLITRALDTGRYKDATSAELADALDDVDERMDEWLAKTNAMLNDTEGMLGRMSDMGRGSIPSG